MSTNPFASGLLAASLALTGSAADAQTPAPAKAAAQEIVRSVRVAPGRLKGRLLQSGTRAPAEGKEVVVRSADGKDLGRMVTGPDGSYETPNLAKGTYQVTVGDGLRLDLNVTPDATISNLDIVLPPSAAAAPAPGEVAGAAGAKPAPKSAPSAGAKAGAAGAAGGSSGGLGVLGWSLIAVGGAAAVAVPVAVAASGGNGTTPVSGSGARVR